jgi:iron-regulated transporter 1
MWEMSIVLLTAQLTDNSLTLVALSGFMSSFSLLLFMPTIGHFLDRSNRMTVVIIALLSKVFFLTFTYVLCAILLAKHDHSDSFTVSLIYTIPLLYACASLSFNAITQSIEKDWLVVLSAGDSHWLTSTNSVMSQIDLAASALGPVITGFVMSSVSASKSSLFFLASNALVAGMLYYFLKNLYESWPQLAERSVKEVVTPGSKTQVSQYRPLYTSEPGPADEEIGVNTSTDSIPDLRNYDRRTLLAWIVETFSLTEFFGSGCSGVMISYSFLFATVLSFGPLMMVYLRWAGMSDHWIGISRGIASLTGFIGAYFFPTAKKIFGIRRAGLVAVWYQSIMVAAAAVSFVILNEYRAMVAVTLLTVSNWL